MVIGVALAVAVVFGRSIFATCISIIGILLVFAAIDRWKAPTTTSTDRPMRLNAEPFRFDFAWQLEDKPVLAAIQAILEPLGFRKEIDTSSGACLSMIGGSQLWTRLFGGYFVRLDQLPLRAKLGVEKRADYAWQLELEVSDRFGWAIRNSSRKKRPEMATMQIKDAVESWLAARALISLGNT